MRWYYIPSHQISFSDNSNSMVAVYVESLHTIFAVVYRPPDSPDSDFSNCMDKLLEMINDHSFFYKDDRHSDVYVIGDFNMPVFNWEESAVSTNPPNGAYQRLIHNGTHARVVARPFSDAQTTFIL